MYHLADEVYNQAKPTDLAHFSFRLFFKKNIDWTEEIHLYLGKYVDTNGIKNINQYMGKCINVLKETVNTEEFRDPGEYFNTEEYFIVIGIPDKQERFYIKVHCLPDGLGQQDKDYEVNELERNGKLENIKNYLFYEAGKRRGIDGVIDLEIDLNQGLLESYYSVPVTRLSKM